MISEGNITALQYGELELITGDSLGAISVWWIESGELLQSFNAHDGPVSSLQVDYIKVISCGRDKVIQVSDIIRGEVLYTLRGHAAPVLAVAFDRKQIISLSSDGELRYWSWESPSSHSRSDSNKNENRLRRDFGSNKQADAIENVTVEDDDSGLLESRSSETKGTLISRLANKFPPWRNA